MEFENFYKKLGVQIKCLREAKGLTQEQLAERADISLDFMSKIEVNINKPGLRSLLKIARVLGVSFKDLFDFE